MEGGRGVYSLTAEHKVLSCPLSSLPLSPRHGRGALRTVVCGAPTETQLCKSFSITVKKATPLEEGEVGWLHCSERPSAHLKVKAINRRVSSRMFDLKI